MNLLEQSKYKYYDKSYKLIMVNKWYTIKMQKHGKKLFYEIEKINDDDIIFAELGDFDILKWWKFWCKECHFGNCQRHIRNPLFSIENS